MSGHGWGRTEKYQRRPRHIYALLFGNGCVYVGQTVDLKKRTQQHRLPSGGWNGKPFEVLPLDTVTGTQAQASDLEVGWRLLAHRAGFGVYAKPPGIPIRSHGALVTPAVRAAMRGKRWPSSHLQRTPWWTPIAVLVGAGAMVWGLLRVAGLA